MIEIKDELTAKLENAKARYAAAQARYEEIRQEARQVAEAIDAEVEMLIVLIEKFDEHAKDNTRAFRAVPDRSAEGVALRAMQPGVTYLDREGWAWKVTGEQAREDGVMLVLTGASGQVLPADQVIHECGPLRKAPNVVDFAEGVVPPRPVPTTSDPGGAHPAADISATRPGEPQGGAS